MVDIVQKTMAHPPVDTKYVAGIWHPARFSLSGIVTEARVMGASLVSRTNPNVQKFLIISRARSGSTLATLLLNENPDVTCGREVMVRRVLFPRTYLGQLAKKCETKAYGAKLLSYQMIQVQRLRDPVAFLGQLVTDGFKFIHIERETFAQTLSLYIAQSRRIYHQSDGSGRGRRIWEHGEKTRKPIEALDIDVAAFVRRLEWNEMLLEYERYCLRDIPHLRLSYELELQDPASQQAAADRMFAHIGVQSVQVQGGLKKLLPNDPREVIANYSDLAQAVRSAGLGNLLPE